MPKDEREMTRNEQVILTAINTLDFSKYKTQEQVDKALYKRISTIENYLREDSIANRILDSVKIPATIISIELEQSSKRFVITYKADKSNEETETIRSDRTDTFNGDEVKKLWKKELVGKRVLIYKTTEQTNNPKKPTVRIAPFVKEL